MPEVGQLTVELTAETVKFTRPLQDATRSLESLGKKAQDAGASLEKFSRRAADIGRSLSLAVTAPIMAIGGAAVKMAMDAVESENLFEVSMGKMAGAARQFSEELRQQLGLNAYEVRKQVGTFNVMFTSLGLGEKAAYGMATALTKLAYDMASFYNLSPEDAFLKLQAAISGEIEPLRRLGIVVSETTVQQYALREGLIKQGETLSETGKIFARFGVIMEQTQKAQGDLARTIDSPANQLRILQSEIKQTAIDFGMALLPAMQDLLPTVRDLADQLSNLVTWFSNLSPAIQENVIKLTALAAACGPVALAISGVSKVIGILVGGIGALIATGGRLAFAFAAWRGGAATFGEALSLAFGGPVGVAIAAIVSLISIGVLLYKNWDTISYYGQQAWGHLKVAVLTAVDAIAGAINTLAGSEQIQRFQDKLDEMIAHENEVLQQRAAERAKVLADLEKQKKEAETTAAAATTLTGTSDISALLSTLPSDQLAVGSSAVVDAAAKTGELAGDALNEALLDALRTLSPEMARTIDAVMKDVNVTSIAKTESEALAAALSAYGFRMGQDDYTKVTDEYKRQILDAITEVVNAQEDLFKYQREVAGLLGQPYSETDALERYLDYLTDLYITYKRLGVEAWALKDLATEIESTSKELQGMKDAADEAAKATESVAENEKRIEEFTKAWQDVEFRASVAIDKIRSGEEITAAAAQAQGKDYSALADELDVLNQQLTEYVQLADQYGALVSTNTPEIKATLDRIREVKAAIDEAARLKKIGEAMKEFWTTVISDADTEAHIATAMGEDFDMLTVKIDAAKVAIRELVEAGLGMDSSQIRWLLEEIEKATEELKAKRLSAALTAAYADLATTTGPVMQIKAELAGITGERFDVLEFQKAAIIDTIDAVVSEMVKAGKGYEEVRAEIDPLLKRLRSLSQEMRELRMATELVDSLLAGVADGLSEAGNAWADFMATVVSSLKVSIEEAGLSVDWETTLMSIAKSGLQRLGQAIVELFAGADQLRQEYPYGSYGEVNYPDLARMRENYQNWDENLQKLQQAQQARATMTVGGGLLGGLIGFLIGGPIGALIGAGVGAGAGYAAGQATYGKQIEELKKKLEDTFQKIAETLGTTIGNIADALGNAFSADTYQGFLSGFATNLESVVKQALVKAFMAGEAMRPLLQGLSDFITVAVWDGTLDASEKLQLGQKLQEIVGVAQPFWEALQEFDFTEAVGGATEALNEFSEALRNVPTGYKIQSTRWDVALPAYQEGGVVGKTGIALLHAGETVIPADGRVVEVHIHGDVYGWDDFKRRVAQANAESRRQSGLASHGLARAGAY